MGPGKGEMEPERRKEAGRVGEVERKVKEALDGVVDHQQEGEEEEEEEAAAKATLTTGALVFSHL